MSSNQQPPNMLYPVANGLSSSNPFVEVFSETRAPTADDVNFPIQKKWFDKTENKEWILVGFTSNTGKLQADWRRTSEPIEFIGGVGTAGTFPVTADNNGDILLQSTDLSVLITGGTNSLDFTANGSVIVENFTVDAVTAPGVNPVTPNAGNVIVGADVVAAHNVPIETRSRALHEYQIEAQFASSNATTNAAKVGLAAFSSAQFSVDANGFVTLAGGTTPPVLGLIPDAFTAPGTSPVIPNGSGNITITAGTVAAGSTPIRTNSLAANTLKTEVQFSQAIAATDATKVGVAAFDSTQFTVDANGFVQLTGISTTDLHWPTFIVGDTANGANYSTIAAAVAASSSGDTIAIQPGTYTENITLKNGVNIVGLVNFGGSGGGTKIVGKLIDNGGAVNSNIYNLSFDTNSDFCIALTGSGTIVATNCRFNATNNTIFSCAGTANIDCYNCYFSLATTGVALYTGSSGLKFISCVGDNTASSTTASSCSGSVSVISSNLPYAFATSSSGVFLAKQSIINTDAINTTVLTTAGTGTSSFNDCELGSGTATCVSVGSGTTVEMYNTSVSSTNTNPVSGAGTYKSDATIYNNTGYQPSTTTRTFVTVGEYLSWTPVLQFGGASTGITYTTQVGSYTRIGNVVTFTMNIVLSSKGSATGSAAVTGLPYASAAITTCVLNASLLTYTGQVAARIGLGGTQLNLDSFATTGARVSLTDTAFVNTTTLQISGSYLV